MTQTVAPPLTPPLTPLDPWIRSKINLPLGRPLTREALSSYQLEKLRELLAYVRRSSPFYQKLLASWPDDPLPSLDDLAGLPFITPSDLRENGLGLLCVSQSEVARIVTLQSSGTTAQPKRIFFTEEDLDLTVDFFHHGISTLVEPGGKVMVFMPGVLPGSVGDLLVKGLDRLGAAGVVHGPVTDENAAIDDILRHRPDCLVGIPAQMLALARHERNRLIPRGCIRNVLLSTDYVPQSLVRELNRAWNCRVFNHYGMTEMGLGGGVECRALAGSHLREADLYFEIVDPETGEVRPDGEWGEVVFTTLTRKGMPLLRYRTGDLGRFLPEPCPCGTTLKRLDKVMGRLESLVRLAEGDWLSISLLDEHIYNLPDITGYQAEIHKRAGRDVLTIQYCHRGGDPTSMADGLREAVEHLPPVRRAMETGTLELDLVSVASLSWQTTGPAKRKIMDRRAEDSNLS